jgi:hypothetical protein
MGIFDTNADLDTTDELSARPARATAPPQAARRESVNYWFVFDRWLPVREEADDFVLA